MDPPNGTDREPARAVAYWLRANGCAVERVRHVQRGGFDRHDWTTCANGPSVSLDLHPGGHWIPKTWLDRALGDMLRETIG